MIDSMTILAPIPTVANYKPTGLNQHKFMLSWFSGGQKFKISFSELKSRCRQGWLLLGALKGGVCLPVFFHLFCFVSSGYLCSLACGPFLLLQSVSPCSLLQPSHCLLLFCLSLPLSSYKNCHDVVITHRMIQDNLPPQDISLNHIFKVLPAMQENIHRS